MEDIPLQKGRKVIHNSTNPYLTTGRILSHTGIVFGAVLVASPAHLSGKEVYSELERRSQENGNNVNC